MGIVGITDKNKGTITLRTGNELRLWCAYDPVDIIDYQVEFLVENEEYDREQEAKADHQKRLHPGGWFSDPSAEYVEPEPITDQDKSDMWDSAAQDYLLFESEWDHFKDCVNEWLNTHNTGDAKGFWHINANNMGWRHLSGEGVVAINNFDDIMKKVLPDTDMVIRCYINDDEPDEFTMIVSHHDSMGESYVFTIPKVCNECGDIEEGDVLNEDGVCEWCVNQMEEAV